MDQNSRHVAAQLRKPSGLEAYKVADKLNKVNGETNLAAIAAMGINANDRVLEIGPGNGKFAESIISSASDVTYAGLDWSQEMVDAASQLNAPLIQAGKATFSVGTSAEIPFADKEFTKAISVHTIYFWEEPRSHLHEIKRVLKTGGQLCLCFGDESFMKSLPFVQFGFQLYDKKKAESCLAESGFKIAKALTYTEIGRSNSGGFVEKLINILVCST
ncbi:MAG: class I SAM-dependent methyltransferase [Cyanobacteria bacterium P01_D01_bin.73]